MWGVILALLFTPLYLWMLKKLGRRPTLAALCTMLVMILIVVLPATLIMIALAQEASGVY